MQLQIPFVILELRIFVAVSAWHLARSYLRVLCVAHIKNQGRVHCRHGILRPISTLHTRRLRRTISVLHRYEHTFEIERVLEF